MNTRGVIQVAVLGCFILGTGCNTITSVRNIGVRQESLSTTPWRDFAKGTNGAICVTLDSVLVKPGAWHARKIIHTKTRYVIATRLALERYIDDYSHGLYGYREFAQARLVWLSGLPLQSERQPGWIIVPSSPDAPSATDADLPEDITPFVNSATTNGLVPFTINDKTVQYDRLIPYEYRGETYYLGAHFYIQRNHYYWYHYPSQLLLIPGFVVDVVTSPIQLFMALGEL